MSLMDEGISFENDIIYFDKLIYTISLLNLSFNLCFVIFSFYILLKWRNYVSILTISSNKIFWLFSGFCFSSLSLISIFVSAMFIRAFMTVNSIILKIFHELTINSLVWKWVFHLSKILHVVLFLYHKDIMDTCIIFIFRIFNASFPLSFLLFKLKVPTYSQLPFLNPKLVFVPCPNIKVNLENIVNILLILSNWKMCVLSYRLGSI